MQGGREKPTLHGKPVGADRFANNGKQVPEGPRERTGTQAVYNVTEVGQVIEFFCISVLHLCFSCLSLCNKNQSFMLKL